MSKAELSLEKGPVGIYVTPCLEMCNYIAGEVTIADVKVKAPLDSGAFSSCCSLD